jgi:hypothetical protein
MRGVDERFEMAQDGTVILYRPVGQAELELVRQSGWQAFPPRLDSSEPCVVKTIHSPEQVRT